MKVIQLWDKAIRFYHWSQLLLLAGLWFTADQGYLVVHQILAYSLAAILLSRLIWGFVGSETARFSHFLQSPPQLVRMWNKAKHGIGHRGLSGYMSLVLMTLILLQFISGLMTTDDVMTEGPLYSAVSSDWSSFASWFHHNNFDLLLILIAVHVVAALFHGLKKDGVLGAMLHGKLNTEAQQPAIKSLRWYLLLVLVFAGIFALWQGLSLYQQW
ncbi:MAG: cytochrome b/b6 domain-containing protein [Gammaproteobacteria bacterium]|nr:cytochrome b/b6 domain-containing protein [Gammaproteobacteria bacterium]MBU2059776.1 cytochrome b/b6 domain-containing protein [Gammaproteobacteria bacterium]MBU2175444.1 cytochrome b/b6 domain-containing protein [Gammaproteobacteria bacterium]MBU2245648.1 cytochrome b/b6 domain-containing protein [Gammaproteobacteria bacterium]MBU2342757.1 cytochrome b/b6 domain-containing protein [Gammaproteobacteria bacterium]